MNMNEQISFLPFSLHEERAILGGAVVSHIRGEDPRDLDVFCLTREAYDFAFMELLADGWISDDATKSSGSSMSPDGTDRSVWESPACSGEVVTVDLILSQWGTIDDVLQRFDVDEFRVAECRETSVALASNIRKGIATVNRKTRHSRLEKLIKRGWILQDRYGFALSIDAASLPLGATIDQIWGIKPAPVDLPFVGFFCRALARLMS